MKLPNSLRDQENNTTIIHKYYLDILKREPDELGLNHYLNLMKNNEIDENKLVEILRNSDEYKRISLKESFIQKYDMSKNFYGKVWVGQDHTWYADMFNHVPILHKNCVDFLKNKKDAKTILEIGCGAGVYPIELKRLFTNKEYTGIDISESAITHCKHNSNFEFICGDFLQMNLSKKYDLVFSNAVIDHVYDVDLFLSKIISICQKYAYVSAYYGYYPNLPQHEMHYVEEEGYYLNKLSVTRIKETLLQNGLQEDEFVVRPQEGGHKDVKEETVIEIQRKTNIS